MKRHCGFSKFLTANHSWILIIGVVAFAIHLVSCNDRRSKADNDFDIHVQDPMLTHIKPVVLFDEAHNNHHSIKTTYRPFARLLTNDGCTVSSARRPADATSLEKTDIYIIATASGQEDPGDKSPFTEKEIDDIEKWVLNGGSLLLVTEHYPFGLSMAPLLHKFGVDVHNGYTEDTLLRNKDNREALLFTKANGNLHPTHPVMKGVDKLNTFTGSAVKGDSSWTQLLTFSPDAQNFNVQVSMRKDGSDVITDVSYDGFYDANDYAQAICKSYGHGKIAVLAEAGFLTAQIDRNGNKFGMNIPHQDNKQFALNLIRWLAE